MKKLGLIMVWPLVATGALFGQADANAQPTISGSLGLFAYPSGGQSIETQMTDERECYQWAQQSTGIDPENPPSSRPPAQVQVADPAGSAAAGAMRGAARGALIANATDNDWEKVAVAGLIRGARRGAKGAQERNAQAQQEATAEREQAIEQEVQTFRTAYSACMEGREYTVK
jgi:hypothetical protein